MDAVLEVLRSSSFIEKAILLVAGGAATGFFFPFVRGAAERRATREATLVEARAWAFQEIAALLWQYHYLAMREAYAGSNGELDSFSPARTAFHTEGWEVLKDARSRIGGARWLLAKGDHIAFVASYKSWCDKLNEAEPDGECGTEEWRQFHAMLLDDSAPGLDYLLGLLADSFSLPSARRSKTSR